MRPYYKSSEKKLLGKWVSYGWHFQRFSIEFTLDKYSLNIGLGFIWFGVEF